MPSLRLLVLTLLFAIAPLLGCNGGAIEVTANPGVTTCSGKVSAIPRALSDLHPRAIVSDGARLLAIVAGTGTHEVWSVDACSGAAELIATVPIDKLSHVLGLHQNMVYLRGLDAMGLQGPVLRIDLNDGSVTSLSLGDWGTTNGHDSFSATLFEDTVVVLLNDHDDPTLYHLLAITNEGVEHLYSESFDAGPLRLKGANAGGIYLSRDYDCGCKLGLNRWTPKGGLEGVPGTTLARSLRQRDGQLVLLRDTAELYQDREWELAQIPFAGGAGTTLRALPDAVNPSWMAVGPSSICWRDDGELYCHRDNLAPRRVTDAAVAGSPIIIGAAVYWLEQSESDEGQRNLMVATP